MEASSKHKTPLDFHKHADGLEDAIQEKLRQAENLIDEAMELIKTMRWHDKMATYVMSNEKIDPFKFAKQEKERKEAKKK